MPVSQSCDAAARWQAHRLKLQMRSAVETSQFQRNPCCTGVADVPCALGAMIDSSPMTTGGLNFFEAMKFPRIAVGTERTTVARERSKALPTGMAPRVVIRLESEKVCVCALS